MQLWDLKTGQPTMALEGHTGRVSAVAFSPDGRTLATASEDHTVRLWDLTTGQLSTTLEGHSSAVSTLSFVSDGRTIAFAGHDRTVRVWDGEGAIVTLFLGVRVTALATIAGMIAVGTEVGDVVLFTIASREEYTSESNPA